MQQRTLAALLATLALAPLAAHAAPLPEMIGAIGRGGWNARVTGASAASAYFNPALLPDAHEDLSLDFYVLGSALEIRPGARPAEADVGSTINDGWQRDGNGIAPLEWRPLPTARLSPRQGEGDGSGAESYVGIGLVKRLLGDELVFGLQVLLPAGKVQKQTAFYNDEREQFFGNSLHFEMLGDRLTLSTISAGVGGRVLPDLAIGAGFSMGLATSVTSPVFVPDAADYGQVFIDNQLSVSSQLAPHFGVLYEPDPRLALSATLHLPFEVKVEGKNLIRVSDTEVKEQNFTFVNGYEPLGAALAAEWRFARDGRGLALAATGTWRKWSDYTDRHGEAPLDEWNDTFTAALGARWTSDVFTVHLDGLYAPSPVPAQEGRTNYVDNDRVGLAGGVSLDTSLLGKRVRASLALQGQRLLARSVVKDASATNPIFDEFPDDSVNTALEPLPEAEGFQTNNPGYPGYSSSGWLLGAGVSLETWF